MKLAKVNLKTEKIIHAFQPNCILFDVLEESLSLNFNENNARAKLFLMQIVAN